MCVLGCGQCVCHLSIPNFHQFPWLFDPSPQNNAQLLAQKGKTNDKHFEFERRNYE